MNYKDEEYSAKDSSLADRGFYSANNYLIGINKYKIVPLIFAKKKPTIKVLKDKISNPLDYSDFKNKPGKIYEYLREKLFEILPNWKNFRHPRWKIEKVFEFLKINLELGKIHAYTLKSVSKKVYLTVFLMEILILEGYNEIQEIILLVNFK
ncbi:transposase [Methanobrevibacter curvatus]|uniref:Transposase IS4-like domain-containing protein n=1 Tax=Methanobrevibacter curvatus TaxID=49547 RepID=A0A166DVH2_9EURY|nr:transposase [Methanobrevibacter curvatus]KZX15993.1 hypothetical protein MBCUR_01710 [Methanobrevibacter curvatus]